MLSIKLNAIVFIEYNKKYTKTRDGSLLLSIPTPSLILMHKRTVIIATDMADQRTAFVNHENQCIHSLRPIIFIDSLRRFSFSRTRFLVRFVGGYMKLNISITGNRNWRATRNPSSIYGGYGNRWANTSIASALGFPFRFR